MEFRTSVFWASSKVLIFGYARQKADIHINKDIYTVLLPYLWDVIKTKLIQHAAFNVQNIKLNLPIKPVLKPRLTFLTKPLISHLQSKNRHSCFSIPNTEQMISRFNAKMVHDCQYVLHIGLGKMNKSFDFWLFDKFNTKDLVKYFGFQLYYVGSIHNIITRTYFNCTQRAQYDNDIKLNDFFLRKNDIISVVVDKSSKKLYFELNSNIIKNTTACVKCKENEVLFFFVMCVGVTSDFDPGHVCELDVFPC